MTKIYKRRRLAHLTPSGAPAWAQLGDPEAPPLSEIFRHMGFTGSDRLFICGSLEQMTREYMTEPLMSGWAWKNEFVFKHRTATYCRPEAPDREISVKLISHRESWLPGCEDMTVAVPAWRALESEWASTGLPLLSTPAASGKALLWEALPVDKEGNAIECPALSDDVAKLIRSISPQHRMEKLKGDADERIAEDCLRQYDGRWMYAAMCGLDRFPMGAPRKVGYFKPFEPGWHHVAVKIPETWNHVGLLPVKDSLGGWFYPSSAGEKFTTWAAEPELTLAVEGVKKLGLPPWEIIEHYDGWAFDKGRPLALWSSKLIEMRGRLQAEAEYPVSGVDDSKLDDYPDVAYYRYAAAAIRQILNSTIGALHKNEYEREMFVSEDNYRMWRREHPDLAEGEHRAPTRVEGGYMVPTFVPDTSRLSIFMPHWSATIYSLARARVAEWALRCEPETLVKIHGDAIYSTIEQPELDKLDAQRLGQPRRK